MLLFIYNNSLLNIFITIMCIVAIYKYSKSKQDDHYILYSISFFLVIFISYNVFIKIVGNRNIFIKESYNVFFQGILVILFYISILVTVFICIQDKMIKKRLLFELISSVIIAAPLLIVTPIGPRCFFPTYIFLAFFAIDLYDYLILNTTLDISYMFNGIILIMLLFLLCIYGQVFIIDNHRINYINEHKNDKMIVLPKLPYENYMQCCNPTVEEFYKRFKLFYKINTESKLNFLPYHEWKRHKISSKNF